MSTKRIREALTMLRTQAPGGGILSALLDEAEAEVEAIKMAARVVTNVAEAGDDETHAQAVRTLETIAKESDE